MNPIVVVTREPELGCFRAPILPKDGLPLSGVSFGIFLDLSHSIRLGFIRPFECIRAHEVRLNPPFGMPIIYDAVSEGAGYGRRGITFSFETTVEGLPIGQVGSVLRHVYLPPLCVLPVADEGDECLLEYLLVGLKSERKLRKSKTYSLHQTTSDY